ncbi:CMRF35-like molecule 1 isoform X13 [Lates calcarifer]|uniref:CMRF35-like molecule 1 isoform X13 n=1 Tax=Lates calcarifer TaxID=8187 RepID=A0AAJ8DQ61_LATCA|nr:CMRF35-like molecule 1 isoform X13 [Lates calcarifer]
MKVHHTLIFFFLTALQETDLINAETFIRTGTEGGNMTVTCRFNFHGSKKIFCKNECKEDKDILIKTGNNRAQSGRYSIEYEGLLDIQSPTLNVTITQLTKSDSGRYWCGLGRTVFPNGYYEIDLRVTDAPTTSKPNLTVQPFSTSLPSASTSTTSTTTTVTQSLSSSSGSSTPSSSSPETNTQPKTSPTGPGVLLYVGLTLLFMIIVLSVAVLIFCRKNASKPKEPPADTVYANVTVANQAMREDRRGRSPPVEVSTVYSQAKYTKANRAETTDDYSLVAATASSAGNKAEDDALTYSEVEFVNGAGASHNSAPSGNAEAVIYSEPRVEGNDASPPLYSTVTSH